MNKLKTLLSTVFIVVTALSPLQLHAGTNPTGNETVFLNESQPSFSSEHIYAIHAINSGDILDVFLDNLIFSEDNGNIKAEYSMRFEFGNGTTISSTITFFSNGNVEHDSNFDYFKSVLASKPDLLVLFEEIANDSPFLLTFNLNLNTSDPNAIYVLGLWSDFWDYCMVNIVDPVVIFFKNNPNALELMKGLGQYTLGMDVNVQFTWAF